MSNINPSSSVHTSVPPKSGPTSLATISNPPPAVAQLAAGTVIVGTVIRQELNGQTLLRTEHGQLTLTTRLPLPTGTEIKLEVQVAGARTQAIILSVGGQEVSNLPTSPARGTSPQTGLQAPLNSTGKAPPQAQAQTPPQANAQAQTQSQTPPQTNAQTQTTTPPPAAQSQAAAAPATAAMPAATPTPQSVALAATLVPGTGNGGVPLTATEGGTPVRIAPLSLQGPQGAPPTALPGIPLAGAPTGGTILSGKVLAPNGQGGLVLQTPLGQLTLPIQAQLPTGTVITFELLDLPPSRSADPVDLSRAALRMSAEWASLKEAIETLAKTDPAVHATLVNATLPKTGTDIVAKLFHFFSALTKGDVRDWVGERTLHSLDSAGKNILAQQLSDEFSQLSRLALRNGDEWRTILFPMLHESELHQARFFLRHHRDGQDGASGSDAGTRIIVEVSLSRLGDVQLDGLYHARRFDLILRTMNTLPVFMTTEIQSIFKGCCEIAGLRGDILFRADEPFAWTPLRKANNAAGFGLDV